MTKSSRAPEGISSESRFDAAYYRRYYENSKTRVAALSDTERLAKLASAFAAHLGLPLRHALDLGCGVGHWRSALKASHPKLRYQGVEFSEYLCKKYGWDQGSVANYRANQSFDLVICQGVLQYLDDKAATGALRNLAKASQGLLFLEALTREDWRNRVDRQKTDGAVHLRSVSWYRERLGKNFKPLGGGLFLRKGAPATLWALEEVG